eukprot:9474047-Pyramimonas_sp.AAC.1
MSSTGKSTVIPSDLVTSMAWSNHVAPVVTRVPATTCATGLVAGSASKRARARTMRCRRAAPHRVSMRVSASARTCPPSPRASSEPLPTNSILATSYCTRFNWVTAACHPFE